MSDKNERERSAMRDDTMASIDTEIFVIQLTDAAKSYEEWLSIMRFGLNTLLENQLLLMECILREATRQNERSKIKTRVVVAEARQIMEELGLRFCMSNEKDQL